MAQIQLSRIVLPGDPAVPVTVADDFPELQGQWSVSDFLMNLFQTQAADKAMERFRDAERTSQVHEAHRTLFPGKPIPNLLTAKHEKQASRQQPFFLKEKTVPTSIAFAWILWAVTGSGVTGNRSRTVAQRQPGYGFLRGLISHSVERFGRLTLLVSRVGLARGRDTSADITHPSASLSGELVWSQAVRPRIRSAWEAFQRAGVLRSDWQRPTVADLIIFSVTHPVAGGESASLARPLGLSLLRQFATWLNDNLSLLSVDALGYRAGMEKNRARQQLALTEATTAAAMFYLFENASRRLRCYAVAHV